MKNLDQVQKAIELLFEIKNKGYAEFTTNLCAYSCISHFDINIHVDKWVETPHLHLDLIIEFDSNRKDNEAVLAKLYKYSNEGFVNEPIVIERKKKLLKDKQDLLKKLSKELLDLEA